MNTSERKHILEMALSRAKAGSGSSLNTLRESPVVYDVSNTLPDFGDLPFAIVGGLATASYMPERMTLDTNILIETENLTAIEDILQTEKSIRLGELTIGGSSWRLPSGRALDIIALDHEWVSAALSSAISTNKGYPVISLPYLTLMKLDAGRLQDLADISRMLGFADNKQLTETRQLIKQFNPQDIDDLESMIQLGRLEHVTHSATPS